MIAVVLFFTLLVGIISISAFSLLRKDVTEFSLKASFPFKLEINFKKGGDENGASKKKLHSP
jgi:hypothetical protein